MELTTTDRAMLERAAASPMEQRTRRWAAIPSGTADLPGLALIATELADAAADLPGDVELVEPAPVTAIGPDGAEQEVEHGRHLVLTVRPDAPVQLLLTGHMDTVYGPDHPFKSVTDGDDGTINGPGVADMKGGLAIALATLGAVEGRPGSERLGYQLMINSDEETGSASSAALIERLALGKLAALTFEPALPDGTLAGERGGSGNYSITIGGRSAHAGRNPQDGRNALVAAADLTLRLNALARKGLGVNPARIDGGGPNNVVPDLATLRVNFRPAAPEDQAEIEATLPTLLTEIERDHDVKSALHGGFGRPPKPLTADAERLFDLVRRSGAALGLDITWQRTGGVCDGNNIAAAGVPVVDTMGALGGAIHSADEYLIPESLPERAQLSALVIASLLERGL